MTLVYNKQHSSKSVMNPKQLQILLNGQSIHNSSTYYKNGIRANTLDHGCPFLFIIHQQVGGK